MAYKISPSLICMDMLKVGQQLEIMNRCADYLHVDMKDSRFVPTLGLFPGFVEAVTRGSKIPVDCHIMVEKPLDYIDQLAAAGVSVIVPHAETITTGAFRVLDRITACGCRPGVAVNPATSLEAVRPYIHKIRRLTIMTIEPGFPGAPYIPEMAEKIREAARLRRELGLDFEIEMDGSLCSRNLKELKEAGCDVFVAGTAALFGNGPDLEANFASLKKQFEDIEYGC